MPNTLGLIPKERLVRKIGSLYAGSAGRVMAILRELSPENYSPLAGAVAMHRVRTIVERLDAEAAAWAGASIKAAYAESKAVTRVKLEAIGAKPSKRYRQARHDRSIAQAVKRTNRDFLDADRTILATAGKYLAALAHGRKKLDAYRESAGVEAFSSAEVRRMINDIVIQATADHLPRNAAERMIRDRLLGLFEDGEFIEINGRNYNLRAYSELVARTRMREAQTEATKELCAEYENDLVQFSKHDDPCSECAQYEGKVFSLSGKTEGYEQLPPEAEPPVHPRCEHNLNPTSENTLRWRAA